VLLRALAYIGCLRALLSLGDLEIHLITFLKTLIAFRCDRAVVNKNVGAISRSDEPIAFRVVKPLDRAFHFRRTPFSRTTSGGVPET
jgi:hypothetical protein